MRDHRSLEALDSDPSRALLALYLRPPYERPKAHVATQPHSSAQQTFHHRSVAKLS